jgi:hypothetical protein
MRNRLLWFLAVAAVWIAFAARADIALNVQTANGTGALSDYVILRFYAKVNPIGTEAGATGLQTIDATLTTSSNQLFKFADFDFDGIPDPDVVGRTVSQPATNTSTAGTFFRVGSLASFNAVLVLPPIFTDNEGPPPDYSAVKSFRVAGFNPTPDTAGVSNPLGALFGVGVIPSSTQSWALDLMVAADKGVAYHLTASGVPEPAGVVILGVGWAAVQRRKRV